MQWADRKIITDPFVQPVFFGQAHLAFLVRLTDTSFHHICCSHRHGSVAIREAVCYSYAHEELFLATYFSKEDL